MPLIVHAADVVVRPALSRLVDYCDAEQSFMEDANIRMEIGQCVEFLTTIFAESDLVLFRPIETWIELGKKRSRPAYSDTFHCKAVPKALSARLARLLRTAEEKRLNLFFGVCPRLGDGGRFDLAWQIRTVRALWADIDHVTVDEARERVTKAGLPVPSVIVNSGNGVHLYWLLDEARVIDDVGNPPAVEREWTERENGKKKPRSYVLDGDERLYLDVRGNVPSLSRKAVELQDILAGIAAAVGGDHTFDLARLLRLPGTLNRKCERNGQKPKRCELIECDASRKNSLTHFVRFADKSPQLAERKKIAAVQLPQPKRFTPSRRDKLNGLVTACAAAPVGSRSDADWHLICTAIEEGWPKEEVWRAVAEVGKFAERGEQYFEQSWSKAEHRTREKLFKNAANAGLRSTSNSKNSGKQQTSDPGLVATLANHICDKDHFAQDAGGKLYRYQGGVYRLRGEQFVRTRVKKHCQRLARLPEWSSHLANEIVEFIRVDSPLLWKIPPMDVVNVKNGLLDLQTRTLRSHTPDHLSSVQLPVNYDPTAQCPKIDTFIQEIFPDDTTAIAYEIPTWLMTPEMSVQKAILLIGPGGNGKSRYLKMVAAFLGKTNVSNLSLHRLESDRFACARLYGRLANICPDLPTEHLAGTSIFKAITGGDPITGEYKFKDSFDFDPFSRLVFSANSPPRAQDSSDGFFDRWLVIPFEQRFRGEKREIPSDKLDSMLSEPDELSGLLNRALAVLERFRVAGRFSDAVSVANAMDEFHAATDPLTVWLDRHTIEGPELATPKRELIDAFNNYCVQQGRLTQSEKAFGANLKRARPHVNDKQRTVAGKLQWCYLGIGMRIESTCKERLSDSASSPDSPGHSRGSRDSRDYPYINLSHARGTHGPMREDISEVTKIDDRVNRVNPVNASCDHEYVEEVVGDRVRSSCKTCGKFLGYRPKGQR